MLLCLFHFESVPELEHGDIELAKTSRVSNDFDPRDLGVRKVNISALESLPRGAKITPTDPSMSASWTNRNPRDERDELFRPRCSTLQLPGLAFFLCWGIDAKRRGPSI